MPVPKLNDKQLDRLSEVFGNLGLVFFASLVIPFFTSTSEINLLNFSTGIGATLICIIGSLVLLKGGVSE